MFVIVGCCSLFGDVFRLFLISSLLIRVLIALVGSIVDTKVVVQALPSGALAPTVAFHFFNVVLKLLAVCEALVALHGFVIVFKLLVLVLLNGFILLKTPALRKLQLLVYPTACELI